MAFLEPLIAGLGEAGAAEGAAAGAGEAASSTGLGGRLGGMMKDFNDSPVGKIAGSVGGHLITHGLGDVAHGVGSAIGTGKPYERVDIGPMANLD